jgi:hypothetical protein
MVVESSESEEHGDVPRRSGAHACVKRAMLVVLENIDDDAE